MHRYLFQSALQTLIVTTVLAVACSSCLAAQESVVPGSMTARETIDRILKATGATLPPDTVDTIKAGDLNTPVTGIVTTFTPSMEVLRKAVAAGDNLIVTHEPTFYNHLDAATLFVNDPVYQEKLAYIREHHLVVWRFHDAWHMRRPDGIAEGFANQVGWMQYETPGSAADAGFFYTVPPTTVLAVARDLERRLHARGVRIVGNPKLSITKVATLLGAGGEADHIKTLERDDVQLLIVGEAREWETVEYVRDAQQQGRKKALIVLGHLASEEPGMANCAQWLRGVFPGLPVHFIPATEPFWTLQHMPR